MCVFALEQFKEEMVSAVASVCQLAKSSSNGQPHEMHRYLFGKMHREPEFKRLIIWMICVCSDYGGPNPAGENNPAGFNL